MTLRAPLIVASIDAVLTGENALGSQSDRLLVERKMQWANGSGASQASSSFHKTGTLAASETLTLDFASGGGLVDQFGTAIAMTAIKAVYIRNTTASGNLLVGGSNAIVGGGLILHAGEFLLKADPTAAGWAVANGSSDTLTLGNSGASDITYEIAVLGA